MKINGIAGILIIALSVLTLSGCASGTRSSILKAKEAKHIDVKELSKSSFEVVLIADNQQHDLFSGDAAYPMSADYASPVMIRPPQSELWGHELFDWILDKEKKHLPKNKKRYFVHLGDVADISCKSEANKTFNKLNKVAANKWVVAPGNHDGMFYGSYEVSENSTSGQVCRSVALAPALKDSWKNSCGNSSNVMTKNDFIKLYLKKAFSISIEKDVSNQPFDKIDSFVKQVAWRIDKDNPHKSYLVQKVEYAPNVYGIILDTSNYNNERYIGYCGLAGQVSKEQRTVVEGWLNDEKKSSKKSVYILAGHHPIKNFKLAVKRHKRKTNETSFKVGIKEYFLYGTAFFQAFGDISDEFKHIAKQFFDGKVGYAASTKTWINELVEKHNIIYYLSGHRHQEGVTVQDGLNWMELNIGSTLDWPPEYWRLSGRDLLLKNKSKSNFIGTTQVSLKKLINISVELGGFGCNEAWKATASSDDWYLSYQLSDLQRLHEVEDVILKTLKTSFKSLADYWPKNEKGKQGLLKILKNNAGLKDKQLIKQAEDYTDKFEYPKQFKLCQALWASQAEDLQKPELIDSLINNSVFHQSIEDE